MRGFKSFADKTTVQFSPGLTAIVGPNGSGKSNITDAIQWVLGESNVRNLRGQRAEDIIFAGTAKRKAVNSAEVTLTLDNSDKQLPDELEEIAITRRVYRSGESEFFINKRPCRLKDIHRMLADTGLGKDSMAIIGQNKVDAILNSKPEERRLIFEDVAGISRFKMNKAEAVNKINATERNMERMQDIILTLNAQLKKLEKNAQATRKYNKLSKEKRTYQAGLQIHSYNIADRKQTRLENEYIASNQKQIKLQEQSKEHDKARNEILQENEKKQEKIRELENLYAKMQKEAEHIQGQVQLIVEQKRSLQELLKTKKVHLDELQITIVTDNNRILLLEKTIKDEEVAIKQLKEEFLKTTAVFEKARTELTVGEQNWEKQVKIMEEEQKNLTQSLQLMEQTKAQLNLLKAQNIEIKAIIDKLVQEELVVKNELQIVQNEKNKIVEEKSILDKKIANLLQKSQESNEKLAKIANEKASIDKKVINCISHLEILENSAEQYEGYQEATKAILKENAPWRAKIDGAVADLFTVEKKFTTAMEVAMGNNIYDIVCDHEKEVKEAINFLKENKKGRATFLPLDRIKAKSIDKSPKNEEGIIGLANECISYDDKYEVIFAHLVGRIWIAENLDLALKVQTKYDNRLRIVTLDGELLKPGGSITGGSIKKKRGHILQRKQKINDLILEKESLEKILKDLNQKHSEQLKIVEKENIAIASLKAQIEEVQQKLNKKQTYEQLVSERLKDKQVRLEKLSLQEKELIVKEESSLKDLAKYEQIHKDSKTKKASEQNIDMNQLKVLQENYHKLHEEYTRQRVEIERKQENIKTQKKQKTEHQEQLAMAKTKIEPLEMEIKTLENKLRIELPAKKAIEEKRLIEQEKKITQTNVQKDNLYKEYKTAQQNLQNMAKEAESVQVKIQLAQQNLFEIKSKIEKVQIEAQQAIEYLENLGYSKDEAQEIKLSGHVKDWKKELSSIVRAIDALGVINPNAIAEYEAQQTKYEFLQKQYEDLTLAKTQLEKVIKEIDEAMSKQFKEVFDIVSMHFKDIFTKLFEGGKAELVLTNKENILETGIDMLIQPPGKTLKQLSLLSGGERSLTVIALLFAFLAYRPAPFTVLDEVDAALDEANVQRFSSFLNKLEDETQFIVVTHRKPTMQAAQVLHGVTMLELGISQMLSVEFDEIQEDIK